MIEELTMLIRLQEIDTQLMDIEAEKGDLPEQLGALNREITKNKQLIQDYNKILEDVSKQRTQFLANSEEARNQLKKSQSIIFNVKTTREYDAISGEIEQAKGRIAETEKAMVELLTKETDTKKQVELSTEKLKLIEQDYSEKQAEMRDRMEHNQDIELKMQHERDKLVVRLKKPVYAHYERIRKIRNGVGVSIVENGACGYCFSKIPPQRQAIIRQMSDLTLCEVCGCILVSDSKSS